MKRISARFLKSRSKKTKIILAILLAGFIGFVVYQFVYPKSYPLTLKTHKGAVENVQFRTNVAENGYFAFNVVGQSGEKYRIEATAYMNTPLSAAESGRTCVNIPPRSSLDGATVEFKLPEGEINRLYGRELAVDSFDKVFTTCYPSHQEGSYYFNVVLLKNGLSPDEYAKSLLQECKVKSATYYGSRHATYIQTKDEYEFEVNDKYDLEDLYTAAEQNCGTSYSKYD
jgi:hypothetical protein